MVMNFTGQKPAQSSVMSIVNCVHVSDAICPGKSHVITHLVRTPHGQPYTLQPLYVASATEDDNPSPPKCNNLGDTSTTEEPLDMPHTVTGVCIVCQTETINRVVMPCRHACVCDRCFVKLTSCPMCRAPIYMYFTLDGSDGTTRDVDVGEEPANEGWWSKLNTKLNRMLGF